MDGDYEKNVSHFRYSMKNNSSKEISLNDGQRTSAQKPANSYNAARKSMDDSIAKPLNQPEVILPAEIQKTTSTKASANLCQIVVELPDKTIFRSMISSMSEKTAGQLFESICEKFGYLPADDYILVYITRSNSDAPVPLDEPAFLVAERLQAPNSNLKIAIKKRPTISIKRDARKRLNLRISSIGSIERDITENEQSGSQSAGTYGSSSSLTHRTRRLSAGLMGFLSGLGKSKSDILPETELAEKDVPVFDLSSNERKALSEVFLPEHLALTFGLIEDHGLQFSKLSGHGRFLSLSRQLSSLKSPIYLASSRESKVFGAKLEDVMELEEAVDPTRKVPLFFKQCLEYLDAKALRIPGIFRVSGVTKRINAYKVSIDSGQPFEISNAVPHDISSLLKLYLREMAEPLLTYRLYDFYIAAAKHLRGDEFDNVLILLTASLPSYNLYMLKELFGLLRKIVANAGSVSEDEGSREKNLEEAVDLISISDNFNQGSNKGNLMTSSNLAIVIAPNILRSRDDKPEKVLQDNTEIMKVFERILLLGDSLFILPARIVNAVRVGYSIPKSAY